MLDWNCCSCGENHWMGSVDPEQNPSLARELSKKKSLQKICPKNLVTGPHAIWVNYNELTTTSLEIIVSKGKYPQIALIQVSELL